MMRLTKRVFSDLAIWMMGFGILVGILFPFFMRLLGISDSIVMTWWFFTVCMIAGLCVGFVNILLAKRVVGQRLNVLASHMKDISGHLKSLEHKENFDCSPLKCHIPVDSEDAIGASSLAFNNLVDTLADTMNAEISIRNYTQMLTSHLETTGLCRSALLRLIDMLDAQGGAILVDEEGELTVHCASGLTGTDRLQDNPLVLDTLRTMKDRLIDIPSDIELDGVVTSFRPHQVMVRPIIYKQLPLGVILLATSGCFKGELFANLDVFAKSLALALHNAMTHDQVQKLAAVDPLTSAYNRRFGYARLHEEFNRAAKQESALGLLMIDVDKFKQINDVYGHSVGDRVLRSIVTSIRSQLREGDIVVRLGGDEFMVILLGASRMDSGVLAENIRRQVDERRISYGEQAIEVSISVGAVSFPEFDVDNENDLVEAADKALYIVKNAGRNKVSVFDIS
ncbi:MAG: GGDEF domain-containing protein [Spirochaetia bacterium]|jgi:diguanylate cyclase (GGDEF)-like protein|nr:GGDEF domain-containing protein [Spirochaetia bacterium]